VRKVGNKKTTTSGAQKNKMSEKTNAWVAVGEFHKRVFDDASVQVDWEILAASITTDQ
jgi:hypothetical protein